MENQLQPVVATAPKRLPGGIIRYRHASPTGRETHNSASQAAPTVRTAAPYSAIGVHVLTVTVSS